MKLQRSILVLISLFLSFSLLGCSSVASLIATKTPTPTLTLVPTITPTPTQVPTPTEIPFFLNATVWSGDLKVPILIYHRFIADSAEKSTATKMRYQDFENQLELLYQNGFQLISLKDWLSGTFRLSEGKRPLIITMDDLWFADQLYINEDGTPSLYSGIGILWKFAKDHPDFGFSVSVFSNLGDKYYADKHVENYFFISEGNGWVDKLAHTIEWAIENGVDPYNHLFLHPQLDITTNADIIFNIRENDRITRYYLSLIGREDLIPRLGNIIALPYGIWPASNTGENIIKNYKDPEGKPVLAIMEAYNLDSAQLTPSIFSADFDPNHIARITASDPMIQFIIENNNEIPSAVGCMLGPLQEEQSQNLQVVIGAIQMAVSGKSCPEGIFNVGGNIFVAKEGLVTQLFGK
ncbi:MAG: hypothetical protein NTZ74_14025 [Chloroflexi bacterium]|nr:hypothetical protein [Chloroflexota bacterium]